MIYSSVFVSLQGMVSEKPVFIVGVNEKHFQFYNVVISVKRFFFSVRVNETKRLQPCD